MVNKFSFFICMRRFWNTTVTSSSKISYTHVLQNVKYASEMLFCTAVSLIIVVNYGDSTLDLLATPQNQWHIVQLGCLVCIHIQDEAINLLLHLVLECNFIHKSHQNSQHLSKDYSLE